MNQRGISSIILTAILAVVIIAFGVGYLIAKKPAPLAVRPTPTTSVTPTPTLAPSPTPEETVGWKTYRNEEFGFEFKYPLTWTLLDVVPNDHGPIMYKFNDHSTVANGPIFILSQNEYLSLADLQIAYHANQSGETSPYQKSYKERQVLIGGNTWWEIDRVIGSLQGDLNPKFYWISHGDNTFFTMDSDTSVIKILSTFKFIEKDSSFSCGISTITDVDRNSYKTVKIGEQCWLKENLKATKNPEGGAVTRYCYNNDPKICETDGGLYDWNTAMNNSTQEGSQGICPSGWHIPKDSEWYVLESELATGDCLSTRYGIGCDNAGAKLKTGGASGFDGILSGYRGNLGAFLYKDMTTYFWSSTESKNNLVVWIRVLDSPLITRISYNKAFGFSIRCLKD